MTNYDTKELAMTTILKYHIEGNSQGKKKTSRISRFDSYPQKFSPQNFRHATPTYIIDLAFRESFLCENSHFLLIRKILLP